MSHILMRSISALSKLSLENLIHYFAYLQYASMSRHLAFNFNVDTIDLTLLPEALD